MALIQNLSSISKQTPSRITALAGGNPRAVMNNWNGQLRECSIQAMDGNFTSFGILSFPVLNCNLVFSQDLVQHKRPNVAGAKIEATGANPMMFRLTAPFLFGLQRGKGETWTNLFPDAFQQVLSILTDQVSPTIDFVHPTLGHFYVKAAGGSTTTASEVRNGQILEFELIQTNVDKIAEVSVFAAAQSAANAYDTTLLSLQPPPPVPPVNMTNLLSAVRGFIDSTTLTIQQVTGKINNAIYQVQQVEDSLQRLHTAATSGLSLQLERIKNGLNSLKNGNTSQQNTLSTYKTQRAMTVANIAALLQNSVDQLIRLNPALSFTPIVSAGTIIVYQFNSILQTIQQHVR